MEEVAVLDQTVVAALLDQTVAAALQIQEEEDHHQTRDEIALLPQKKK